ncbi:LysR substrate-binding domain-containing protein [Neptuniibacter sp. UBA847]|uniref:LysR substrate-binding domain-containing protein n=1 Tax=Neptuniibacter sp. UBA847 TaxID=1946977 RepID=UPI000C47F3DE|nr:LysR substrate-binding domain-containing protein [Neptuniibacter sp. UBA847]MAY41372.1 transcriptional regulator [Oceanospirillaceae bacterium]|tara:strand:+ start:2358 stop:3221 length:864 start_codon:yes stop_codon:yes gene_type:complete
MELISLKTFKTVAEQGGVLAASKLLHTVQSNITARIKRLEEELDTALFYRKGRKLKLTPAGTTLLEYANKLIQLEQQAGIAVKQVGESAGEIRLGSMESFAAVRMPGLVQTLRKVHPKLLPRIKTETSGALIQDILDYRLDGAFVGGPVEHKDLICRQVLMEELVLVSAKNIPVADSLIMFREGCAYRERALRWLRDNGRIDTEVMNMGTQEGILGCVAVGLGFTLVPRKVVEESKYIDDLNLEVLAPEYSQVPTLLITHKDAASMAGIETLLGMFEDVIPEWESAA